MMERDEELRHLLRRWEAPAPGGNLDDRVWNVYRQSKATRRRKLLTKWLPIAAGVVIVAGAVGLSLPKAHGLSIETRMDAPGFQPMPNGTISIVKVREKQ